MHLDSDTSKLFKKGYDFYMQQDITSLIYIGVKRLEDATKEFLEKISDSRQRREILENMISFSQKTYDVDYGSGRKFKNGDDRQYGLPLAVFYDNVLGKRDLYELVLATWRRQVAVGPKFDFFRELKGVYENLNP